jgi:hypothetical protein
MKYSTAVRSDEIKTVGQSGQISLGKAYAGKTLRLRRLRNGRMMLTPVAIVAESQLWTLPEPHRSRIAKGLAWATKTAQVLRKRAQKARSGRRKR